MFCPNGDIPDVMDLCLACLDILTCSLPLPQIHRAKAEKARERQIKEEMDAKRARTKAARERKLERQAAKRNALLGEEEESK